MLGLGDDCGEDDGSALLQLGQSILPSTQGQTEGQAGQTEGQTGGQAPS